MNTKEAYKQKMEAELELAQAKLAEFKMHDIITHWQGALQQQRDGLKQIMDVGLSLCEALLAAEGPIAAPQNPPDSNTSEKTESA